MGKLLASIFRASSLTPETNAFLHNALSNTIYNSRIPQGINYAAPVAHKTGTMEGVYNDAAIVHLDGNPFVLVVLSRDASVKVVPMMRRLAMDIYQLHQSRADAGAAASLAALNSWLSR